jgi:hypothetical protein
MRGGITRAGGMTRALLDDCAQKIGVLPPEHQDAATVLDYLDHYEVVSNLERLDREQIYRQRKDALLREVMTAAEYEAWTRERREPGDKVFRKKEAWAELARNGAQARRDNADKRPRILRAFKRLAKVRSAREIAGIIAREIGCSSQFVRRTLRAEGLR